MPDTDRRAASRAFLLLMACLVAAIALLPALVDSGWWSQ